MDKSKQPGINFDGIILVGEEFWRNHNVPSDSKIDLKVQASNNIIDNKATVEITSILRLVHEAKDVLSLESRFVGLFSVIDGDENMGIEEYIQNNSPALMFPYIREHISTITGKAGIKPILLPPVNLLSILNKEN